MSIFWRAESQGTLTNKSEGVSPPIGAIVARKEESHVHIKMEWRG